MFKKGERRDDRNDDRVELGGGESRIDVRRMGRSRFEDTYSISAIRVGGSLNVPRTPHGPVQPHTPPSAAVETPPPAGVG